MKIQDEELKIPLVYIEVVISVVPPITQQRQQLSCNNSYVVRNTVNLRWHTWCHIGRVLVLINLAWYVL